jgi:hypothetical protein
VFTLQDAYRFQLFREIMNFYFSYCSKLVSPVFVTLFQNILRSNGSCSANQTTASNQSLLWPEPELEAGSPQLELALAGQSEVGCVQCFPALPPGERNFQFLNREEGFIKLSRWVWWQKIRTGCTHKPKIAQVDCSCRAKQNFCCSSLLINDVRAS